MADFWKSEYAKKLRDPRWQKMRLQVLERDEWRCRACGDETSTLHVHHRYYIPGRQPWEYPLDLLVTLCEECHEEESENLDDAKHDLMLCFAKRFFSGDIMEIAHAIEGSEFVHLPQVVASALCFVLRDRKAQEILINWYFECLASQRAARMEEPANGV